MARSCCKIRRARFGAEVVPIGHDARRALSRIPARGRERSDGDPHGWIVFGSFLPRFLDALSEENVEIVDERDGAVAGGRR